MTDRTQGITDAPFRIAFRAEGEMWVAYLKPMVGLAGDSMLLGSIRLSLVEHLPELHERFMALFKDSVADAATKILGVEVVEMIEHTAPENERSGRA